MVVVVERREGGEGGKGATRVVGERGGEGRVVVGRGEGRVVVGRGAGGGGAVRREGEGRPGAGDVVVIREWDFWGGEDKGKREEVWCGVYVEKEGGEGEVWVGTSEGWVWRKKEGEKGEGMFVGMGVKTMVIVGSQVS